MTGKYLSFVALVLSMNAGSAFAEHGSFREARSPYGRPYAAESHSASHSKFVGYNGTSTGFPGCGCSCPPRTYAGNSLYSPTLSSALGYGGTYGNSYGGMGYPSLLGYGGYPSYGYVGSSRVDLQACKLEYSIVSPK